MKIFKISIKILLFSSLLLASIFFIFYLIYNKPLPKGSKGKKAIVLLEKVQKAINQTAWDSTRYVEWSFMGMHDFIWDKKRHFVQVKWKDNKVLLNANTMRGIAYKNDKLVKNDELVKNASSYFTNDSFWLNAPAQMTGNRDLEFKAVKLKNGNEGLLVTYLSGGDTAGDSYLWILDDEGLPKSWQMWVEILPIGGLEFDWENWMNLETGARVSTTRKGLLSIYISNLKSYQNSDIDIFKVLE